MTPRLNTFPQADDPALLVTENLAAVDTPYYTQPKYVFTLLPVHIAATCPLDSILLGFLNSRREMLSKGTAIDVVVGPIKASVKALVQVDQSVHVHPLSRVMSEVLSTYALVGKAEQMALFYLMHQTMRVRYSYMSPLRIEANIKISVADFSHERQLSVHANLAEADRNTDYNSPCCVD
jgi:hypothetical protein